MVAFGTFGVAFGVAFVVNVVHVAFAVVFAIAVSVAVSVSVALSGAEAADAGIGAAARRRVLADYVWAERLHGFDALFGVNPTTTPIAEAETVR